jgi:quercetin dioxygenase-like cupin family protein
MTFWHLDTLKLAAFRPGIMSKAEIGEDLIMVCMQIDREMEDTGHVHSFDQCGMVLGGEIEMLVGDERRLLGANQSYFIPAGVRHGWKTFAHPARLLDISPKQPNG